MPSLNDPNSNPPESHGRRYWRSLDHLADTPEFREFMYREFPAGATELLADRAQRREFLKVMAASMALAGFGLPGCRRWPDEKIMPYTARPENRTPGVPVQYASCYEFGGVASGVLVTAFDGRPTKIEGNPDHPTSRGAADLYGQASVLDLYDVDRSRFVREAGKESTWPQFVEWAQAHFGGMGGRGGAVRVLSEATSSPSVLAMKARLQERFPEAQWHEYEPLNNDQEVEGTRLAFGSPHRMHLELDRAKVIVTLDADFIGSHRNAVQYIRGFARSRRIDPQLPQMSRLYAFESEHSLTGANADHRLAVRSSDIAIIAAYLAAAILENESLKDFASDDGSSILTAEVRRELDHALEDLRKHSGAGVLVAGPRQPAEVHLLVHLMNERLGNTGRTVRYTREPEQTAHVESLRRLVDDIGAGRVETLLILGGNPAFNAPVDLDFAAALEKVKVAVHLGDYYDETAALCRWHVNRAHYLETWGDGRAWDGAYSVCQPVIRPLFDGRSAPELLAVIVGDDVTEGEQIVKRTFEEMTGGGEQLWRRTLHDGVLEGSTWSRGGGQRLSSEQTAQAIGDLRQRWSDEHASQWEVVFSAHPTIYDGRFANNGWLQELPDPVTKLTWDNAAIMSPADVEELDVKMGDIVRVAVNGRSLDLPVMPLPGVARGSIVVHLGYGRGFRGQICADAGFDVQELRTSGTMGFATGASLEATGEHYDLACTQDHHTIDTDSVGGKGVQQRLPTLYRESTLEHFIEHPDFAKHRVHAHSLSLFPEDNLSGAAYRWAMSIDLNACVGCLACVTACQAENNIPIVGKQQVIAGREMHWIRVDRYFDFAGSDDRGYDKTKVQSTALMPVPCMHCENAPCEQVCPVAATLHDEDGLNVMVYNRCVGTRYCSNNCPYKVRRFNYYDWHRRDPVRKSELPLLQVEPGYYTQRSGTPDNELKQLQFNPEVTVRMRGIMEKCTYCVQRITAAKIEAKNAFARLPEEVKASMDPDGRIPIEDGTLQPACAQTCPAEAIVFGDLNDPESRVVKLRRNARSYEMLEELNVDARTRYLAQIRNPAHALEEHGKEAPEAAHHG